MPQFLVPIIAAIGAGVGGLAGATMIMYASEIAIAAVIAGGLAYSSMKAREAKEEARQAFNAAQTDRLVNVISSTAARELVLGRVRKAGTIFYRASTGANSQDLYLCIALAGHEVDAIETIYLNDVAVTLDAGGNVTNAPYAQTQTLTASGDGLSPTLPPTYVAGSLVTGSYGEAGNFERYSYQYTQTTSYVKVTRYTGAPGQAADPDLIAAFPADWSAANTVQGVAYLVVRLRYSEAAFPTGVPAVSAVLRGAKLYDPRTGLTAWSQNPALMMRHVYTHPRFGKAGSVTAAEEARFTAAANACDTSTIYTVAGTAQAARALYQAGIVVPFGAQANSVLDDLAQAMGGSWAFAGGAFYLKPGSYTAPVMTLTDADLAVVQRSGASESQKPISIASHRERARKINTVKAKIWDSAQDFKETALTPLTSATLLARDGAELVQEISMPAVGYAPQALHIAGIIIRDARDPLTVQLPFKLSAYPLELFDTVSLTLARYGWTAKTFMVLGRSWGMDGAVMLTLKETTAAIVTMDASFLAQGYAANTNLPSPWIVATVAGMAAYSGTSELQLQADGTVVSRLRITWPQHPDIAVRQAGQIEVQIKDITSDGAWAQRLVAGDDTALTIADVQDGATYLIRAQARTTLASSDWSANLLHTVVGKTAAPADVAQFLLDGTRLSWTPVADIDRAGYEIRFNYGVNAFWDSAGKLHEGLITDSPYTMTNRPVGIVTLLIKAVDTSGNYSANATAIFTNFGTAPVSNLYVSWPQAPGFTDGGIVGGAVAGGVLQATGTDRFYGTDDEPFYGLADTAVFYELGTYTEMTYTWYVTPISTALPGSLTLAAIVQASNYNIEYLRESQAVFYSPDADPFYGPDAELFWGVATGWQVWPGSLALSAAETVGFRITTAASGTQGQISQATPQIDVPDVLESINDLVVSSGGTRLPLTKTYRVIENVQLTVQANGGTGITARIEDKNATLGPLVKVLDTSGLPVAGLIDADVQGY